MDMKEKLQLLAAEGREKIRGAKNEVELQEIKAAYLGKKGSITELMKGLPSLPPEERRDFGQAVNAAKNELSELVETLIST